MQVGMEKIAKKVAKKAAENGSSAAKSGH